MTHLLELSELLVRDYREERLEGPSLRAGGVVVRLVGEVLLIRGTDEPRDWGVYNLRFFPLSWPMEGNTRVWHRGFLHYAETVYGFATGLLAGGKKIKIITGHSLGGAAAQIVGSSLKIKTITFGSPKPLWSSKQPTGSEYVINFCGIGDPVCYRPKWGYQRVGSTVWMKNKQHSMVAYHKENEKDG